MNLYQTTDIYTVYMYVYMYVCIYLSIYACMYVCNVFMYVM